MTNRAKTGRPKARPATVVPKANVAPPARNPSSPEPERVDADVGKPVGIAPRQTFGAYGELAAYHKANMDAFLRAGGIWVRGVENLSRAVMAFGQAHVDQGMATAKAMLGVKNLHEMASLHTEYARARFDALIAEAVKLSEMSVKVAGEVAEPLAARANDTLETIAKPRIGV